MLKSSIYHSLYEVIDAFNKKNIIMKRRISIFAIAFFSFSFLYSQPGIDEITESIQPISGELVQDSLMRPAWKDYWKFDGFVNLKAAQTQLINLAAGGQSSFNTIVATNLNLKYKKNKMAWENGLNAEFGAMYSSDFKRYNIRKSNDKLDFSSKFGYEVANMWFITALGTFKSQFYRGYTYADDENGIEQRKLASNFLSPSFTEISVGVDWKWKDMFSIYVSPVAGLVTTCLDSNLRGSFSVPMEKNNIASLGMTIRGSFAYTKVENLKIQTTVQLYTPYTDTKQKFGNFNVDWDFLISYTFVKVLNVSLTTSLKYYEKTMIANKEGIETARVQFMENFTFGIGYSF